MSDMKCPICNSNLIITRLCDGIFPNPNKGKIDEIFCDKCKMHGTEELWQKLICTHKALNVARNGLEYIFGYESVPEYVIKHISQVLDQIKNETALEQGGNNDSNS